MRKLIVKIEAGNPTVEVFIDSKFAPMKRVAGVQGRDSKEVAEKVAATYNSPGYWRKSPLLDVATVAEGDSIKSLGLVAWHEDLNVWWSAGYHTTDAGAIAELLRLAFDGGALLPTYTENPVDPDAKGKAKTEPETVEVKAKGKGKGKKVLAPAEPQPEPEPTSTEAEAEVKVEVVPEPKPVKAKDKAKAKGIKQVGEALDVPSVPETVDAPSLEPSAEVEVTA